MEKSVIVAAGPDTGQSNPRSSRLVIDESVDYVLIAGDLHSVAVPLSEVDRYRKALPGHSQVLVNGDIFPTGGQPIETLEWVMETAGEGAVLGNHDEGVLSVSDAAGPCYSEPGIRSLLGAHHLDYLRRRPYVLNVTWRGHGIRITHGHRHVDGRLRPPGAFMSKPTDQADLYWDQAVDLVVLSHTHFAFVRNHHGMWVANTGSTSLPISSVRTDDGGSEPQDDRDQATQSHPILCSFLLVQEDRVDRARKGRLKPEIVYFDYDREALLGDLQSMGYPNVERWRVLLSTGVFMPNR